MEYNQLKLENQLCFPIYAASRLITREYQPLLQALHITYPQYLVLMVLWEHDTISVNDIAHKLILNTNTITPLLKRMEQQELIVRTRDEIDERRVLICLTKKGRDLQKRASKIPEILANRIIESALTQQDLVVLKKNLTDIISFLMK